MKKYCQKIKKSFPQARKTFVSLHVFDENIFPDNVILDKLEIFLKTLLKKL